MSENPLFLEEDDDEADEVDWGTLDALLAEADEVDWGTLDALLADESPVASPLWAGLKNDSTLGVGVAALAASDRRECQSKQVTQTRHTRAVKQL